VEHEDGSRRWRFLEQLVIRLFPLLPRLFLLEPDFKAFTTQYSILFSRSKRERVEDESRPDDAGPADLHRGELEQESA
jgi:hypothetical protein